jgi:hypothetical protein
MLVGCLLVEAKQDGSIRIEVLRKVIMGRKAIRLTEERLAPFEAGRDIAYRYNLPGSLHQAVVRKNKIRGYAASSTSPYS